VLTALHHQVAGGILVGFALLIVWGVAATVVGRGVTRHHRSALVAGELLIVVQSLLGAIMFVGGGRPAQPALHVLYGLVALIALPAALGYTRGRPTRWDPLVVAIACGAVLVIGMRSFETG